MRASRSERTMMPCTISRPETPAARERMDCCMSMRRGQGVFFFQSLLILCSPSTAIRCVLVCSIRVINTVRGVTHTINTIQSTRFRGLCIRALLGNDRTKTEKRWRGWKAENALDCDVIGHGVKIRTVNSQTAVLNRCTTYSNGGVTTLKGIGRYKRSGSQNTGTVNISGHEGNWRPNKSRLTLAWRMCGGIFCRLQQLACHETIYGPAVYGLRMMSANCWDTVPAHLKKPLLCQLTGVMIMHDRRLPVADHYPCFW
jgi:hypothetical protein